MEHGACNVIYIDRRANDEFVRRDTLSSSLAATTSTGNVNQGYFNLAKTPPAEIHGNVESILSTFNQGQSTPLCSLSFSWQHFTIRLASTTTLLTSRNCQLRVGSVLARVLSAKGGTSGLHRAPILFRNRSQGTSTSYRNASHRSAKRETRADLLVLKRRLRND